MHLDETDPWLASWLKTENAPTCHDENEDGAQSLYETSPMDPNGPPFIIDSGASITVCGDEGVKGVSGDYNLLYGESTTPSRNVFLIGNDLRYESLRYAIVAANVTVLK